MAREAHPLTDKIIRDAIRGAGQRHFPLYDGHGLHIIDRDGHYHWRLKYTRPDGRENRFPLGAYPEVSLAEARSLALEARAKRRRGIDPQEERKAAKTHAQPTKTRSFAQVAREWLKVKEAGWSAVTLRKNRRAIEHYLLPRLGAIDVAAIETPDVLPVIQDTNKHSQEYAITAASAARGIVRYASAHGLRGQARGLDLDLRNNLPKRKRGHMAAATTPAELAEVLHVIRRLSSSITRAALMLCCYTAQRPGNVAAIRWECVQTEAREWVIPHNEMKVDTGLPHVVPLSLQALELLDELGPLTGRRGYVLPPLAQQHNKHLTADGMSKALRDAGLRGIHTPHGFRASFRTIARQALQVPEDVLEAHLAHAKKGQVQSAYDRAMHVPERHVAMQRWADYLDSLNQEQQ